MSPTSQGMWLWYCAFFQPPASSVLLLIYSIEQLIVSHWPKSCHPWTLKGFFFFIRFMLIQYHACIFPLLFHIFKLWPFLPLRVWNMNLNLLFIAFAWFFFFNKKKKQQTPLLMSNWIKLQWLEMCCFDIKVLWRRFRCMLAFAA